MERNFFGLGCEATRRTEQGVYNSCEVSQTLSVFGRKFSDSEMNSKPQRR